MRTDAKPSLYAASALLALLLILGPTTPGSAQEAESPTPTPTEPTEPKEPAESKEPAEPAEPKEPSIEHDPYSGHPKVKADQHTGTKRSAAAKKADRKRRAAPADSEPAIEPEKPTPSTKPVQPVDEVRTPNEPADACAGGLIVEDGIVDKGFSFVTTAKWGMYVQEVQSGDFPSRHLQEVCACWFQKPGGGDADFEVVFFTAEGARPSMEPYATVQATAKGLGEGKRDARWHSVDVSGVSLPEGTSYIGVRWKPTKEPRLFVCSDQSAETPRRKAFFGEDRSRGWVDLEVTADPIFIPHRALMLRTASHPEGYEPPPAEAKSAASATPQVTTP